MSLPVAATVSGIDSLQVLRQLSIARGFTPMTTIEMTDGSELYKTSKKYDVSPGREQHGFPAKDQIET